jgi:hypothetical protein
MRRLTVGISAALLVLAFASAVPAAAPPAGPAFATVVDNLDVHKNTKLHAREYWKGIAEQRVSWSGVVTDVRGSRSHVEIYVASRARPLYKGYNLVVVTNDVKKSASLKKGDSIKFSGTLHKWRPLGSGGALLTVTNAELN